MVQIKANLAKQLGDAIKAIRIERGLTATQLCGLIDRKPGVVSAWETGQSVPDLVNLLRFADAFGLELSEVLRRADVITGEPVVKTSAHSMPPPYAPETFYTEPAMLRTEWNRVAVELWHALKGYGSESKDWKELAGVVSKYARSAPDAKRARGRQNAPTVSSVKKTEER